MIQDEMVQNDEVQNEVQNAADQNGIDGNAGNEHAPQPDPGSVNPSTDDKDEKGVPYKNRYAEYRRKYEKLRKELDEVRAAVAAQQSQPQPQDDDDLVRAGYDPKAVSALNRLLDRKLHQVLAGLQPVVQETYAAKMEQQIAKLKSDKAIGALVAAYEQDIREQMAQVRNPALLGDERAIRAALGIAMSADPSKLAVLQSQKSMQDDKVVESSAGTTRSTGPAISDAELAEFMADTGIADARRAREILAKRLKVLAGK